MNRLTCLSAQGSYRKPKHPQDSQDPHQRLIAQREIEMTRPSLMTSTPKQKPQAPSSPTNNLKRNPGSSGTPGASSGNDAAGVSASGTPFTFTANPSQSQRLQHQQAHFSVSTSNNNAADNTLTSSSSPTAAAQAGSILPPPEHAAPAQVEPLAGLSTDITTSYRSPERRGSGGGGGPGGKKASKRIQPNGAPPRSPSELSIGLDSALSGDIV